MSMLISANKTHIQITIVKKQSLSRQETSAGYTKKQANFL